MSIKDDISKMLAETWEDQTTGAAFQQQVQNLINYELSHRVRTTMQRTIEDKIIREVAMPYIEARVKALEPGVLASIDRRLTKVLEELEKSLPQMVIDTAKDYVHNWVTTSITSFTSRVRDAIYRAFEKAAKEQSQADG